jgi:5-methyltetrahydropteroyltriglutamate--homocysteine methyltransferase
MAEAKPPFRADHVGSLLRPPGLLRARADRAVGKIDAAALRAVEDDAIRDVVRRQEGIGLQAVTDGEFRRNFWHLDFFERIEGLSIHEGQYAASFKKEGGTVDLKPQRIVVDRKLTRSKPIQVEDFKFLKSVSRATAKVSIPSPAWLYVRSGRDNVSKEAYPDLAAFAADLARVYAEEIADLAAAGCAYLQLDETHFATLCDPQLREDFKSHGRDPDVLLREGVEIMNRAIADAPDTMTVCTHACRGNFRSAWVAEGGYDPVAEMVFNTLEVDGFFLEYDDARSGSFAPLRFVPKDKRIVLGLVTSKKGALETKDQLKRRIDEAARFVPLDQLCLSPQCGFSSSVEGNEITPEAQWAKLRTIVETAREVWGAA